MLAVKNSLLYKFKVSHKSATMGELIKKDLYGFLVVLRKQVRQLAVPQQNCLICLEKHSF